MTRSCLYCGREFHAEFATDVFCGTYCSQAWWMPADAAAKWADLEFFAILAWDQYHHQ